MKALFIPLLLAFSPAQILPAMTPPTEAELALLPAAPETLSARILAAEHHPILLTKADIERGRQNLKHYDWAKAYLSKQEEITARFIAMDEAALRALIPPAEALYVMGLGMNLDPIHEQPLVWCGWDDPYAVRDSKGERYPNDTWPDRGFGIVDEKSKKRYFFTAVANYRRMADLEDKVLPALADVYALTGSKAHARTAAILLDAIAAVYPDSFRGPLDYPMGKDLRRYGGKMNRPTQQVARGMANYAQVIDVIAASGELQEPSTYAPEQTRGVTIAKRLLWDGASYCLMFGQQADNLSNGVADYNYGAAAAGVMLREPRFYNMLLSGEKSIYTMLANNLVRRSFYFETSPAYEFFTLNLYLNSAELIDALRREKLTEAPSLYDDAGAASWMTMLYQRRAVGHHIPLLGNTRVDTETLSATGEPQGDHSKSTQGRFQHGELVSTWRVALRSSDPTLRANAWKALYQIGRGTLPSPLSDRFFVFHYNLPEHENEGAKAPTSIASDFDGGKGLAMLRGAATPTSNHGVQLLFGPSQIKSQHEALTWTFFHDGAEWSYDPGRYNAHFRFGWCTASVAHQSLVVNRKNVAQEAGSGFLKSFHAGPEVQWALGSHPGAYRAEGVTRFERWIGQVSTQEGALIYWIDIAAVAGGELKEESFHSQMEKVDFQPSLQWQNDGKALMGDVNLGDRITSEYRLQGSNDGFYWAPPGDGFGFLGNPRRAKTEAALRTIWRSPAFHHNAQARLIVDYAAPAQGAQREYLLADGPLAPSHPRVLYLIRSDKGTGTSFFTKALHFASNASDTKLLRVETLALPTNDEKQAWLVVHHDGAKDLWFLNAPKSQAATLPVADSSPLETDAALLMARFGHDNELQSWVAEGATYLRWKGTSLIEAQQATVEAEILEIKDQPEGVALTVRWIKPLPTGSQTNKVVNQFPLQGMPASWKLKQIEGDQIYLEDRSDLMGSGLPKLEGDWLIFPHELSRFALGRTANRDLANGKPVYTNGRYIGRIAEIRDDAKAIRLASPPTNFTEGGRWDVREWAKGDRITLSLQNQGTYSPNSATPPEL